MSDWIKKQNPAIYFFKSLKYQSPEKLTEKDLKEI